MQLGLIEKAATVHDTFAVIGSLLSGSKLWKSKCENRGYHRIVRVQRKCMRLKFQGLYYFCRVGYGGIKAG
jgi:hypothetical protein